MDSNWKNYVHTEDTLKVYKLNGTWESEIKHDELFNAFVSFGMNPNLHFAFQLQLLNSNVYRRVEIMSLAWTGSYITESVHFLRAYTFLFPLKNVERADQIRDQFHLFTLLTSYAYGNYEWTYVDYVSEHLCIPARFPHDLWRYLKC